LILLWVGAGAISMALGIALMSMLPVVAPGVLVAYFGTSLAARVLYPDGSDGLDGDAQLLLSWPLMLVQAGLAGVAFIVLRLPGQGIVVAWVGTTAMVIAAIWVMLNWGDPMHEALKRRLGHDITDPLMLYGFPASLPSAAAVAMASVLDRMSAQDLDLVFSAVIVVLGVFGFWGSILWLDHRRRARATTRRDIALDRLLLAWRNAWISRAARGNRHSPPSWRRVTGSPTRITLAHSSKLVMCSCPACTRRRPSDVPSLWTTPTRASCEPRGTSGSVSLPSASSSIRPTVS
jgi:hypothetical protein